ncbi:hypothetical protein ACQUZK_09845, partial [Streptococcus pyogenes]|uniref:hypothetical protein n=1 Tax=Streptococcus pyogenes TaxID=1314 RepID=UPI003DA15459
MTTTPSDEAAPLEKVMRLRYAGTCRACGTTLDAGTRATYLKASKTVRCLTCPGETPPAPTPAVSAAAPEHEPESDG